MAAVGIAAFGAEGGDFIHFVIGENDADGAVLFPGVDLGEILKDFLDFGRCGGGTQVIVVGLQPQQRVPDAATYGVGRKAGIFQSLDAEKGVFRKLQGGHLLTGRFLRKPGSPEADTAPWR